MELTNEFVIDRPIEETWSILNDLEFIAPCMPGAQLQEIEGDEYRGIVKIKVGPVTAQYKGKASFVEQNEVDKVAKLKAEGRDPRQGNANALITASMKAVTEGSTSVEIVTDLALSGKIASFGRGAIEDVSKKLLGQFSENLRQKLEDDGKEEAPAETAAAAAAPASAAAAAAPAASTPGATASASDEPEVRKIHSPDPEPVDILSVTGDTMAKRLAPVLGGVVLLMILRWLLRGRASD